MSCYKMIADSELQHHGVLGMKWGVRRDRKKNDSSPDEKRERRIALAKKGAVLAAAALVTVGIATIEANVRSRSSGGNVVSMDGYRRGRDLTLEYLNYCNDKLKL